MEIYLTKIVLTLVTLIPNKGENNMRKCKKNNLSFFILVIISLLGTGTVNKDSSPELSYLEYGSRHETCF